MMYGISCNNYRVPTKGGLVIKDIFAKMAFQMAKNGLFGQKWPFQSFFKVCLACTLYLSHKMSEQESVQSNSPFLRKSKNI